MEQVPWGFLAASAPNHDSSKDSSLSIPLSLHHANSGAFDLADFWNGTRAYLDWIVTDLSDLWLHS